MKSPDKCPFCSSDNIILMPTDAGHYYHACTDCGGTGPCKSVPILATEFWNNRGKPEPTNHIENSAFNRPQRAVQTLFPK